MTDASGAPPLGPGAEFDLIRRFLAEDGGADAAASARADVRVGPGDDCAVVAGDGIVLGADLSVEGVHFRRDWIGLDEAGYRAAASSLSDLAAMAARPIGVLASLAVPASDAGEPAVRLMAGIREAATAADAALLGGDVVRSPGPLTVDVVVVGEAEHPVLRRGGRVGDEVWVTGRLGAAAAAVEWWRRGGEPSAGAREAFVRPRPRIREARWLAERGALHALIDLSDGLAGDAQHLAEAGGTAVVLELERVPVHPAAEAVAGPDGDALGLALGGGEDYELCFAGPAGAVDGVRREFEDRFGVGLSRVGELDEGDGVRARRADGAVEPLPPGGYRHFEGDAS